MTIETICDACIKAVMDTGYNESTIFNYKGVVRRFNTDICNIKVHGSF